MSAKSVAIIGAGVSGLAKTLGGIWSPDWAYVDLHTQTIAGFMELSNLHDSEAMDCAPWQKIHNYLKRYAENFHLFERIQFETTVLLIDKKDLKNPYLPWLVTLKTADGNQHTFEFDFIVVAHEKFGGSILHTIEIKNYEQFQNKRVVVIGGAKSAVDMATLAAKYGRSCHMVFPHPFWILPDNHLYGYLPLDYAFSRIFTSLFDPFPYAPHSALFHFIHRTFPNLFTKLTDGVSRALVAIYRNNLFADKQFIPKDSMRNAENIMRVTEEYVEMVQNNRIIRKLTSIDKIIDKTTLRLNSGELVQADLIVFATGFIEKFAFLSKNLIEIIVEKKSSSKSDKEGIDIDLYRRIVPIGIPNLAFLGLAAPIHTWMFYEVQCHWISDYFLERIQVPRTEKQMYEEIETTRKFIREMFKRKSYYFQYYWLEPIEIYLYDMGLTLHRTNNWISEYFSPYLPRRISTLHDERRAKAQGRNIKNCYFSFGHTILLLTLVFFFYYIVT